MTKVLCVLYDDPVDGHPKAYARDGIPWIERYPGGQSAPTPKQIDFTPGELLGSVSGSLGLRKFLEGLGHSLVVTSDKGHPETEHLFNDALIGKMKRGAYLVNTARGKICDRDAVVRALNSGQLAGYAGDVWFPQPARCRITA